MMRFFRISILGLLFSFPPLPAGNATESSARTESSPRAKAAAAGRPAFLVEKPTAAEAVRRPGPAGASIDATSSGTSAETQSRPSPRSRPEGFRLPQPRPLPANYVGDESSRAALADPSRVQPTALAAADFDEDGVPDLVSGYATADGGVLTLHRGNLDAIYPENAGAQERRAAGTFTDAPFLAPARAFDAPEAPDFVAAGDFNADGHQDVAFAARGGRRLLLFAGDGQGSLAASRTVELQGPVVTFAAGEINRADGLTDLVVGVSAPAGPAVLVFEGPRGAMSSEPEVVRLAATPTALALGRFTDGAFHDLALAAGEELMLVRGRDRTLSSADQADRVAPATAESIARGASPIRALAWGDFDWDAGRGRELAALSADGRVSLYRLEAGEGAGLPAWQRIASREVAAALPDAENAESTRPLLVAGRVSGLPMEELVVTDPVAGQLHVTLGEVGPESGAGLESRLTAEIPGGMAAVLPMRLNMDGQSDLVVLGSGAGAPMALPSAPAAIMEVNSTLDTPDIAPGNSSCATAAGVCTLRAAIQEVNALAGPDEITFNISGATVITVTSQLPTITTPVTINGWSQPGASPAVLKIEVTEASPVSLGLPISGAGASGTVLRGLVLRGFSIGTWISSTSNVIVEGCYLGTNVTGLTDSGNALYGVEMISTNNSTVGGTALSARNVISGNDALGVYLSGTSSGNTVQGNYIGTTVAGNAPLGNTSSGVGIEGDSNLIGFGATNVIAGNNGDGITIFSGTGNLVLANRIGTNAAGVADLGNSLRGIYIAGDSNTVGSTLTAARNVIAGNGGDGIWLDDGPTGNVVRGNYIGTNAMGNAALANDGHGVLILDSAANTVGGAVPNAGNVISASGGFGVAIAASDPDLADGNVVQRNRIGTDASGAVALGNTLSGIIVQDASLTLIGGAGVGNLISGNEIGVYILSNNEASTETTGNVVQGNIIGTDAGGTVDRGNVFDGVLIQDSSGNLVGGTSPGQGNLISGNDEAGVWIWGFSAGTTAENRVEGNRIGTRGDGTGSVPNGIGVFIQDASSNHIGGTAPGAGNVIAGNTGRGVIILEDVPVPTIDNEVLGNSIWGNTGIGIDLDFDGVTLNDPGDGDGSPNRLQNFPVLSSSQAAPANTLIGGTLDTTAGTFRVEFFSNPSCDASGHGEGERLIGSTDVTTAGTGAQAFQVTLPARIEVGEAITATATDPTGSTSEFSACASAASCSTVFGETIRAASDKNSLVWTAPADVRFSKGVLGTVSSYATTGAGLLSGATSLDISADAPGLGSGLWYLLRPDPCGSWQSTLGAEPGRDGGVLEAPPACGDGVLDVGEPCDDGNEISGDGCDDNCTFSACGNGVLTACEQCEDGNGINGDGCESDCTVTCVPNTTATPRFFDNCDGTVTDLQTCLMWEKKTGTVGERVFCNAPATCPDPHDVNNKYRWSSCLPYRNTCR